MKFAKLALGVSAYFTLSMAQAISLDIGAFGTFENISAGSMADYSARNNDEVTDSLVRWGLKDAAPSSAFGFNGLGSQYRFNRVSTPVGSPFEIGLFSWYNGTPGDESMNVNRLDLQMAVYVGATQVSNLAFDMKFAHNDDAGKHGTPDRLKIYSGIDIYRFSLDGATYDLKILGFSFDGGATFEHQLVLKEGDALKARFYAMIKPHASLPKPDPQAVPVPAAIWLLGSGLIGLVGVARRRR